MNWLWTFRSSATQKQMFSRFAWRRKLISTALGALRSVGAFSLAGDSRHRKNSLLILCYHGLALEDEHEWRPDLYITAEQFRQRLHCLRNLKASVLPLGEALVRLRSGTLPARSVTITFDDGFYDFLQHGAPALTEFGYPATVYLTTHYSNYRLPINNLVLDYLLWKSGRSTIALPDYGLHEQVDVRGLVNRLKVVQHLRHWMQERNLDTTAKDGVARTLADHLGVSYEEILRRRMLQILSPDEVAEIAKSGVDVQLHTHRHRMPRDQALFNREIDDNRRQIQDMTGKVPVHFCYPSGVYSPESFAWLKGRGVESATTCEKGLALKTSEMLKLPRVLDDSNMPMLRFESVVSGLLI